MMHGESYYYLGMKKERAVGKRGEEFRNEAKIHARLYASHKYIAITSAGVDNLT